MQTKTKTGCHLRPVRLDIIKKGKKKTCWWGFGEKETLAHYRYNCRLVQALWRVLKKLKTELPSVPEIPLLGIYPKKTKRLNRKHIKTSVFTAGEQWTLLFTVAMIYKQLQCSSMYERIQKMCSIHIMECYPAIKENEVLLFVRTWMDWEVLC